MLRTGVNPFESGTWALFLVVTHGLVYAGLLGSFAGLSFSICGLEIELTSELDLARVVG